MIAEGRSDLVSNKTKISMAAILSAAYLISMPFSIVPLPGGISLLKLISYAVGGFMIIKLFLGDNKIKFNLVHLFLIIYVLYSISSWYILQNEASYRSLRGIFETSVIFFFISTRVYNERERNLFVNVWIIIGFITSITTIWGGTYAGESERATLSLAGGVEDANQLCGYFILPVLLCVERIQKKKKIWYLYVGLILLMLYAVVITGSRGGLAAVLAATFSYIFLATPGIQNKLKILLAVLLISALFFTVLYPLLPSSVTERLTIESVREDRGSGRFVIWETLYRAITKDNIKMFFGYGLSSTVDLLADSGRDNTAAHNHWLQIWADQGFIGMSLFFLFCLAGVIRTYKHDKAVLFSLFGMFVLSLSLTMYAQYKPFWNVLMMSALNYQLLEGNQTYD